MSRGNQAGVRQGTAGARLVTRHGDGTISTEALLTFDPFGLGQGRTHHGTLGWPRYAAWKRERRRFQRHQQRVMARERLRLLVASDAATGARRGTVGR